MSRINRVAHHRSPESVSVFKERVTTVIPKLDYTEEHSKDEILLFKEHSDYLAHLNCQGLLNFPFYGSPLH